MRRDLPEGALMETGLETEKLFKIWELSDMDEDGALDSEEFAVAIYLCECALGGEETPNALPADLVPPSKR